jgi:hypothetical protein
MTPTILLLAACAASASCAQQKSMDQRTARTISQSGGRLLSPDGLLELGFSPNAVRSDTDVTITLDVSNLIDPSYVSGVYELEPHGITFGVPVDIVGSLEATPSIDQEVVWANVDGSPAVLPDSVIDTSHGEVHATLAHFSRYAMIHRANLCRDRACGDDCSEHGVHKVCSAEHRCVMPERASCSTQDGGIYGDSGAIGNGDAEVLGDSGNPSGDAGVSGDASNDFDGSFPGGDGGFGFDSGIANPDAGSDFDTGPSCSSDGSISADPDASWIIHDGGTELLVPDVEPNSTMAQAQPLDIGLPQVTTVAITAVPGDDDWFTFTIPFNFGVNVTARTHTGNPGDPSTDGCSSGIDTLLSISGASGEIASNDNYNGTTCSQVDWHQQPILHQLTPGTYWIHVRLVSSSCAPVTFLMSLDLEPASWPDAGILPRDASVATDGSTLSPG